MLRGLDVLHNPFKRFAAQGIVRFFQSIHTDKHRVRCGVQWIGAVGVDNDRSIANTMGIVHNVLQVIIPVLPQKRLSSLQIQTASTGLIKGIHSGRDLFICQILAAALRQLALLTLQIAAIRQHQSIDEGDLSFQAVMLEQILHAIQDGFHEPTQVFRSQARHRLLI